MGVVEERDERLGGDVEACRPRREKNERIEEVLCGTEGLLSPSECSFLVDAEEEDVVGISEEEGECCPADVFCGRKV